MSQTALEDKQTEYAIKRIRTNNPDQQLKLDDKTIEVKIDHYPDEVKEPAMWAAAFCREKCNRQVSALVTKCRSLKIDSDYSYWHKIFTGKYFTIGPDNKVIGSVKNFLRLVEKLRNAEQIEWRAGKTPFIETSTWEDIRNFIDKKRQPNRVNKFGGIVGPTGSQKSACFDEYCLRNNHGKCVRVEAPERPKMGQFITDLAVKYGESRNGSQNKQIAAISSAVNETKTIIVDNVQRLYKPNMGGDQPIFNFLQKLQDERKCTIILSYTPDFTRILEAGTERGYFEQFIGRMGGLKKTLNLPDYAPTDDLLMIAEAYELKDAEKHVEYLERISRESGRIRAYFEDLQDAKQFAEDDNKPFTIDYLRMARGED